MNTIADSWLGQNLPLEAFGSSGIGLSEYVNFIRPFLDKIKEKTKIITVAGTNGKGETVRRLSYLLSKKFPQKNYASWTSPHLLSVVERFEYNQHKIESKELVYFFKKNKNIAHKLSYYEFLFYIFCEWVSCLELDYLILEVGLGGRLDCVNCFDADFVALTSIGLDHTEFLGDTLEKILAEKLGVTRKKSLVVSGVIQNDLIEILNEREKKKEFNLICLHSNKLIDDSMHFKKMNQTLAEVLFEKISGEKIDENIWSDFSDGFGRGEFLKTEIGEFLMMGSHNADGLIALEKWLEHSASGFFQGIYVGLSKRPTRELSQCIKITRKYLKKRSHKFCLIGHNHPKAVDKRYLELTLAVDRPELFKEISEFYKEFDNWWESIEAQKNPNSRYLITGSYYFVAQVLSRLDNTRFTFY